MASIEIIAIPPGFAPENIRRQWLNVVIPLPSAEELAGDPPSNMGIGNSNEGGYEVFGDDAIEALRSAGKYEAVAYWTPLAQGRYLKFKKTVCKLLK